MVGVLPGFEPTGDYAAYFTAMFEFGNEQAVLRFVALVLGVPVADHVGAAAVTRLATWSGSKQLQRVSAGLVGIPSSVIHSQILGTGVRGRTLTEW